MKTPEQPIDWAKVGLEPMEPKPTEAASVPESLDTKYAVVPKTEISPRDEAKVSEILEGIQQLPRNTQETQSVFTEDLDKRTSATPEDVKNYTRALDEAFLKKYEAKTSLTEAGPFSPVGAGVVGVAGLAFLFGTSALTSAGVPAVIAGHLATVAAGGSLAMLVPAAVAGIATAAPFVFVGYFGYKAFKYFQAKREETNLRKRGPRGYALA